MGIKHPERTLSIKKKNDDVILFSHSENGILPTDLSAGTWSLANTHTHTHTHTHNEDLLMRFSYFTCQGQERGEISCGLEAS